MEFGIPGVQEAQQIARRADVPVFSALALIMAVVLLSSVMILPNTPSEFQPSVQGIITVRIAILLYRVAARRGAVRGIDLAADGRVATGRMTATQQRGRSRS
jgi:hypothetical protein